MPLTSSGEGPLNSAKYLSPFPYRTE
ncbi:MAG: hypothetical protein FD140_4927, partial [Limisphaerales bacterium]